MTVLDPKRGIIHGYVLVIGPEANPNYFTGAGYSALIDDAKVFRTIGGAKCAATMWETGRRLSSAHWIDQRRAMPVTLNLERPML